MSVGLPSASDARRRRRSCRRRTRPRAFAPRRGQLRARRLPLVEVADARRSSRRSVVSVAVFPSDPPMYRSFVPVWTTAPSVRGAGSDDLGGDGLPRHDRADRRRAGQRLVLGRAEVDRAPGEDPEVDRLVDREVVGPIRDVAEHEDHEDEPEGGLERRPAQPSASSRPNRARPRVCVVPAWSACCAIVLHPPTRCRSALPASLLDLEGALHRRRVHLAQERVRAGLERRHRVRLLRGPGEDGVAHRRPSGRSASWITTLWGAVASWLSNVEGERLSAVASSVVGSKPVVAAPLGRRHGDDRGVRVDRGRRGAAEPPARRRSAR